MFTTPASRTPHGGGEPIISLSQVRFKLTIQAAICQPAQRYPCCRCGPGLKTTMRVTSTCVHPRSVCTLGLCAPLMFMSSMRTPSCPGFMHPRCSCPGCSCPGCAIPGCRLPWILRRTSWRHGSVRRARIRLRGRTAGGTGAGGAGGGAGGAPPWLSAGITGKGPALCLSHRGPFGPPRPAGPPSLGGVHSQPRSFLPRCLVLRLGAEGAAESPSPLLWPLILFTPLKSDYLPTLTPHLEIRLKSCQCSGFIAENPLFSLRF